MSVHDDEISEPPEDPRPSKQDEAPSPGAAPAGPPRPRWPVKAAGALLVVALAVGLLAMLAGFGSRWGLWHYRTGFTLLRWAAYGGIGSALLALPVLWMTRPGTRNARGFMLATVALLLSAPVFVVPLMWRARVSDVPRIHDITTDTNDPPRFQDIAPLRADAPNPVEYPGAEVAAQQRAGYPDIRPVVLDLPLGRAYERALAAAEAMGWEIVASVPEEGRIEATDQTLWFGFKDDVVIRLTSSGDRTIVDVRSKSRAGGSDVGTNARRIRSYLERLTS